MIPGAVDTRLIMLVDDNKVDSFINNKILEISNFAKKISTYQEPGDALDYLKGIDVTSADFESTVPSIIFLDINMPGMSGFKFIQEFDHLDSQIKSKCKIILLTSSAQAADIVIARDNPYVMDIVEKPLTTEYLQKLEVA